MKTQDEIIQQAKDLCVKFVNKVENGMARSKETYADCKALLREIEARQEDAADKCSHVYQDVPICVRCGHKPEF